MVWAGWVLALAVAAAGPVAPGFGAPGALEARGSRARTQAPPGAELVPAQPGECAPLKKPLAGPPPFFPGEVLRYDIDVVGVRAGRMSFEVLPSAGMGQDLSVRVRAESNTFFDKIRRVKAEVVTQLRPKDLRPSAFREELSEGGVDRIAKVTFPPGPAAGGTDSSISRRAPRRE